MVERLVANEKVVGSSPIARSTKRIFKYGRRFIKKKCIPCEGNIPPFDYNQIHKYLKKVDGWEVKKNENDNYFLTKDFKFENFNQSQNFVNHVGNVAEEENHHPDISFGWGYAKVNIFTHAINGLAESDFILAKN